MNTGIILAGGRGSRLGPLAAQISKALVSIGQRPHIIHQIELLRRNGVGEIVVVTSEDTDRQVSRVIERAGQINVRTTIQTTPLGPVDAVASGLEALYNRTSPVLVLMADTYLPLETEFPDVNESWIGVAPAPAARSFCALWECSYKDMPVNADDLVTIGAYRFQDPDEAFREARLAVWERYSEASEVGMAALLQSIPAAVHHVEGWLDIGDIESLARARRTRFIAREQHSLDLGDDGTITKSGVDPKQVLRMNELNHDPRTASLVPRMYDHGDDWYSMDYIDLPTLSELWLYWPGRPDTWKTIVESIIERLARQLWQPIEADPLLERKMFIDKALTRTNDPEIHELIHAVIPLFKGSPNVAGHGDLNFNNILYSMNTGSFKLIDPRGDLVVPLSYEYAKLAYSWHGFAETTHHLDLIREPERRAMDAAIPMGENKLNAAMGCLLVAGSALHDEYEAQEMLGRGASLLRKAQP